MRPSKAVPPRSQHLAVAVGFLVGALVFGLLAGFPVVGAGFSVFAIYYFVRAWRTP
jgi:hypothetical protein